MAMQRKTITITSQMESWVKSQVVSGKYGNDSEYFRDLVRCDQEKKQAEMQIFGLLEEAELSGLSKRTAEEIWDAIEAESE
jgi:antitoxin ParD1/3/4